MDDCAPNKLQGILTEADILACERVRCDNPALIKAIVEEVAAAARIRPAAIWGPARHSHVSRARQIVFYIAWHHGLSLSEIGRAMDRDHSTVRSGIAAETERRAKGEAPTV